MRFFLIFLLILGLGACIFATGNYWDGLSHFYLAGPVILGLVFYALSIFGLYLDMGDALSVDAPPIETLRHFLKRLPPVLGLIIGFLGGAVMLVLIRTLFSPWLPDWVVELLYLISFSWFVAGLIKLLTWLSDRDLLG